MERFGAWLKVKTSESDGGFIGAFVTASLTVCIGAMAIVGSIRTASSATTRRCSPRPCSIL